MQLLDSTSQAYRDYKDIIICRFLADCNQLVLEIPSFRTFISNNNNITRFDLKGIKRREREKMEEIEGEREPRWMTNG